MSSFAGLLFLAILITLALIIVGISNQIQTKHRVVRLKVQQLRTRINELEDIFLSITPLLESDQVPKLINEEIIDLIKSVIKLAPENSTTLTFNLENAEQIAESFTQGIGSGRLNRVQGSDAAIAKHQYYLQEAGKLIRRHQALGRIEEAEMHAHIAELSWAHLMVAVCSHIAQGHRAANKNDPMVAASHYRNASNFLKNSSLTDQRRLHLIKEISEMIAGERLCISEHFMPETEFNPSAKLSQS